MIWIKRNKARWSGGANNRGWWGVRYERIYWRGRATNWVRCWVHFGPLRNPDRFRDGGGQ